VITEAREAFGCFGGTVTVHVGDADAEAATRAARNARGRLLGVHACLSRFLPESELSRFNADARETVPVGPQILRLAAAVVKAGYVSGGLVDATRLPAVQRAGYTQSLAGAAPLALPDALPAAPPRNPAGPDPSAPWRRIQVNGPAGTVTRPPGIGLDSGGIGKGLAADLIGASLSGHSSYAVDCAGDIRVGGSSGLPRTLLVEDPFGGAPIHELEITNGAVATSGIGRRSWVRPDGTPAHHLIDPASGEPAFTGVVQATALAPTAFLAEVFAKVAVLSGPGRSHATLPYGGVVVLEDGSLEITDVARAGVVAA
jgi:thiamine biosynthesis lipoprotein